MIAASQMKIQKYMLKNYEMSSMLQDEQMSVVSGAQFVNSNEGGAADLYNKIQMASTSLNAVSDYIQRPVYQPSIRSSYYEYNVFGVDSKGKFYPHSMYQS